MFIDGAVPAPPYPDWSQSDAALVSIARLLRGLHDAGRGFDHRGLTWNDRLADPRGGPLVCHNDVELSNVGCRNGVAAALIDFEFAPPGRPVYDLTQLARLCVPIDDDFDQARLGWHAAARPARLRLVADSYRLDRDGRAELLTAMGDAIDPHRGGARLHGPKGSNASNGGSTRGSGKRYARNRLGRWIASCRQPALASK